MSLEKLAKPTPSTENTADCKNDLRIPLPVSTAQQPMRADYNGPDNKTSTKLYI